jgi:hypothetical protein
VKNRLYQKNPGIISGREPINAEGIMKQRKNESTPVPGSLIHMTGTLNRHEPSAAQQLKNHTEGTSLISGKFLIMILLPAALFFSLPGVPLQSRAEAAELLWNTFMGGTSADESIAVIHDANGNIFIAGWSYNTWGQPVREWSGMTDAFVAKFNPDGVLQWNTFLGSSNMDKATDIAIDNSGNLYVTGYSNAGWGTPKRAHAGDSPKSDAFAAKLDASGNLLWNTFLGGADQDLGEALAVDPDGNIYVSGQSEQSWETPLTAHGNPYQDGFIAKLDSSGVLQWNTFIGAPSFSICKAITAVSTDKFYVAGETGSTWGTPIASYSGNRDGFVAEFTTSGIRQWNTFFGSDEYETVYDMYADNSTIHVCGESEDSWGTPVSPHSGRYNTDAYVVQLDISGARRWNTFMGNNPGPDFAYSISLDSESNVYVAGKSSDPWGNGAGSYSGGYDAFISRLNSNGQQLENVFLGSDEDDAGYGINVESTGEVLVVGTSHITWGTPIEQHSGGAGQNDGFAAKLKMSTLPLPISNSCTYFVIPIAGGKGVVVCL